MHNLQITNTTAILYAHSVLKNAAQVLCHCVSNGPYQGMHGCS